MRALPAGGSAHGITGGRKKDNAQRVERLNVLFKREENELQWSGSEKWRSGCSNVMPEAGGRRTGLKPVGARDLLDETSPSA